MPGAELSFRARTLGDAKTDEDDKVRGTTTNPPETGGEQPQRTSSARKDEAPRVSAEAKMEADVPIMASSDNPATKGSSSPPMRRVETRLGDHNAPDHGNRWSAKFAIGGGGGGGGGWGRSFVGGGDCCCPNCENSACMNLLWLFVLIGEIVYYWHMWRCYSGASVDSPAPFPRPVLAKILAAVTVMCVLLVVNITCAGRSAFDSETWEEETKDYGKIMLGVGSAFGMIFGFVVTRFVLKHMPCKNCGN